MALRFNPPPNWPAPPDGFTPPAGWQPDPAWGPAPEGWQLWVDDAVTSGASAASAGSAGTGADRSDIPSGGRPLTTTARRPNAIENRFTDSVAARTGGRRPDESQRGRRRPRRRPPALAESPRSWPRRDRAACRERSRTCSRHMVRSTRAWARRSTRKRCSSSASARPSSPRTIRARSTRAPWASWRPRSIRD